LLHVYPFVLYGFYNFYNKEYLKGFTSILVVSIVYITLLVGVISSLGLFAIWMFFKDKKYSYLILIGTVLIGFIFYKISFETKVGDNAGKVAFLKNIKVSIIVFIEDTLKIIVFYFNVLFAAILYFFTKSEKFDLMDKLTLLFVSSAIFIALIFVSVFHGTSDFLQALFNLASPLFLVLFLYVVLKMNTFQTKIILSSSIVFLVIILYGNYNSDLKNLYNKNYTSEYKKQCIESINDNDKYLTFNKLEVSNWEYDNRELASFMAKSKNIGCGYNIYLDIYKTQPTAFPSPFNIWCNTNHKKASAYSMIEYMEDRKINFLFVCNQINLPSEIESNFSLITQDKESGEKLFIIKNKSNV
jgi:hypothetical protein